MKQDQSQTVHYSKVLLLGSGGLKISQAGEFDYSGSQAIMALKEEGTEVVLVNPNIATVQTDDHMADTLYLQPLSVESVTKIIEKERPQAILLGFGGQTALNLGLKLDELGILKKYKVEVLGTTTETIRLTEDRHLFKVALDDIGVHTAKSIAIHNEQEAIEAARVIGFPLMMRSAFSLGGLGSGIVHNEKDFMRQVRETLTASPQILIEECLTGWVEIEYEIVRDAYGNAITVCNMENMDPMGIHTGESIVVCPSQSLDNEEYHRLRSVALQVAEHFKIIGECNIQYAYHLESRQYRVIEMNPRLSRSSALASKATGYPLAFVACKLALGYRLYELKNSITQKTCAFFEPALDYVVVKMPRWDIHKLKGAQRRIGTEMKSVGEVMAIGRSFPEALQKAVGMLNIGAKDLASYPFEIPNLEDEIEYATDRRIFALYQFFKLGGTLERAFELSGIHTWFLYHLRQIAQELKQFTATPRESGRLLKAKQAGFSDWTLAQAIDMSFDAFRAWRLAEGVVPWVKQIDTLAGEFDAQTNYLYLTYHGQCHDLAKPSKKPMVVLGSGPYSIGSSVEFDWCAVNTARTIRDLGHDSVMINCNPETVSTDYDQSDRLYFELLSLERVLDILDFELPKGVMVSVGGQIANNLATSIARFNYPVMGTSPCDIDRAENREKFSSLLNTLDIDQPDWISASDMQKAEEFAEQVGYPVLVRPSFVLSGAAMNVVYSKEQLYNYIAEATSVSPDYPVVISDFIFEAKELEMDGVAQDGEVIIYAISEHVENAGVHSGDATIVMPPQRLYLETIRRTKKIMRQICRALKITGPFNIQFIAKNNAIRVIECNLRASRSFPFASKVTGHNFIAIATQVMLGQYQRKTYKTVDLDYVGVKTSQFSYSRLKGADPVAHVEMASTGEVACLGDDLLDAFYLSYLSTDQKVKDKVLLVSIASDLRPRFLELLKALDQDDWMFYTTEGTHDYLAQHGVASRLVHKISSGMSPSVEDVIAKESIGMIINIPQKLTQRSHRQQTDGFKLRRLAIDYHIPLITNVQSAQLMLQCLLGLYEAMPQPKSWQSMVVTNEDGQ